MAISKTLYSTLTPLSLVALLSLSPAANAQHVEHTRDRSTSADILIRRTIPYPSAVERQPLTSDRLSTTSTRLIDARRGFRPYSSVHRDHHGSACHGRTFIGYDDNFGITRPEYRPYSYSPPHVSNVMRFSNSTSEQPNAGTLANQAPIVIINPTVNAQPVQAEQPKPNMKIRIHNDAPELPTNSGAVLIMSDGTVIQIGD